MQISYFQCLRTPFSFTQFDLYSRKFFSCHRSRLLTFSPWILLLTSNFRCLYWSLDIVLLLTCSLPGFLKLSNGLGPESSIWFYFFESNIASTATLFPNFQPIPLILLKFPRFSSLPKKLEQNTISNLRSPIEFARREHLDSFCCCCYGYSVCWYCCSHICINYLSRVH